MREPEIESTISEAIASTPVGKKVSVHFNGLAGPVEIRMVFSGGWEVEYTLVPGMPLEFVRGEDGYLEDLRITLLPNTGLKPQG